MTKQARSETTKRRIVEGAAQAFERFGFSGTSLGDIQQQSGVTKGALYFHFTSKEDIARAVVEAQHATSIEPTRQMLSNETSGLSACIRMSQELARQLMSDPLVRAGIRLTIEQGTFDVENYTNPYHEWISATEQLIERAIGEGDVRTATSPHAVARFLVSSFTGVQLLSEILTRREDLVLRLQQMWALVLPSIVPSRKLPHFLHIARQTPWQPTDADITDQPAPASADATTGSSTLHS